MLACIHKDAVRISRPRPDEVANGVIVAASFVGTEEEYIIDVAGVRIEAAGPAIELVKGDKVRVVMAEDEWVFVR